MGIELYAHNQAAYQAALAMLQSKGRAAVIHPTGTGKSFIAFKLIQEHPAACFLWLSPSEYIFNTQCENLNSKEKADLLAHTRFMTYARLMLLSSTELAGLRPEYIILDEFHRCGAEHWGESVEALLRANPTARLLGLSATNVRYLDNNRDMAEELFQGHIASEMTLGEAIVRGILRAPKYVTTVFKYQQELARYQRRVEKQQSAGVGDAGQKYLDALRRALEQADGLDRVFARHMAAKSGKYLVFCSGYEHMQEMREHASEWFSGVNPRIHSYAAYSADPETSKAFAAFKADESDALKLLFCIDMLNEGVHVSGISGVILFRPTISPIIYKQQIGRALTAGQSGTPLILDVVNNFEGLCSIALLREEMQTAIQRMYAQGEGGRIVTDRFQIIEQVQNCRVLFEQLQNSLSGTWDQYFYAASEYAAEHGDLNVPKRYKTPGGLSLGEWITTQRLVRAGARHGNLTEQRIARLDSIGMVWENRLEQSWNRFYAAAREYYAAYGNLLVPARYETPDGLKLGAWIANQRTYYANSERRSLLSEQNIARLEQIGMVWSAASERWERNYLEAVTYYNRHGDLLAPVRYKTESGFALGAWLRGLRQARAGLSNAKKPTPEQISRLDEIGMFWGDCNENAWQKAYQAAKLYYGKHGDLNVPADYVAPDGTALGKWVRRQRYAWQKPEKSNARLTPRRKRLLDAIGMQWEKPDGWEYRYAKAREYLAENGNLNIPAQYKTSDGIWLGRWIYEQKRLCRGELRGKTLPPEQQQKLAELGIR